MIKLLELCLVSDCFGDVQKGCTSFSCISAASTSSSHLENQFSPAGTCKTVESGNVLSNQLAYKFLVLTHSCDYSHKARTDTDRIAGDRMLSFASLTMKRKEQEQKRKRKKERKEA